MIQILQVPSECGPSNLVVLVLLQANLDLRNENENILFIRKKMLKLRVHSEHFRKSKLLLFRSFFKDENT